MTRAHILDDTQTQLDRPRWIARVEHEGIAAPAFVLRYSKSSSQNAQVTFAAVALLSLFVLIKPES